MAAQYIPIKRISSLDTPIKAEKLDGSLFTTENQAHEFIISVRKNGVKQTVTGSVSGKFIRTNGTTIFLQGSIVDGDAVVRLHQDCYNVQGRFTFNIFNTQSGVTTCIYSAVGKIDMGSTETVIDAGDVVPDVADVVAKQEEMTQVIADARTATTAANTAATNVGSIVARPYSSSSTYTAGKDYCTHNGNLYKAKQDISTAEEWTASHWTQIVMGDEVTDLKSALYNTIFFDGNGNTYVEQDFAVVKAGGSYKVHVCSWDTSAVTVTGGYTKFYLGYKNNGTKVKIAEVMINGTIESEYSVQIPSNVIDPVLVIGGRITASKQGVVNIVDVSLDAEFAEVKQGLVQVKDDLTSSIDYLANSEQMRVYPVWEIGGIDLDTGDDVTATNSVRSGYIDKNAVALWGIETHAGALYVYMYNYTDGAYAYIGRNQRTSAGNFTNWLKSLVGTHLRFVVNDTADTGYPNTWMTLCYSTQIGEDIESLKTTQTKTETIESNLGYWRQYLEIPAGSGHSGQIDLLPVNIKTGQAFMLRFSMNRMYGIQIYAFYTDGTAERILVCSANDFPYSKSLYHLTANKDIIGISQYTATSANKRTCVTEVITDDSISNLIGYSKADRTKARIQMENEVLYFETGRARFDVNNIHQSIAVWNNQVWEFGEGKAAYNGVVYELENGHANNCNWGKILHGDYPYLYCPTWVAGENKINVFSFDGTAFTLVNTIYISAFTSGHMDAYVDEESGHIYAFNYENNRSGTVTFAVADLEGNTIMTKVMPSYIPVIQGICFHNGILYVTSGFATTEFPNYLNLITTDGTLIGRYPMYNIGEIEGIDFMDDEMILASYYKFYIHPTKLPNPFRRTGIFDQLEATT